MKHLRAFFAFLFMLSLVGFATGCSDFEETEASGDVLVEDGAEDETTNENMLTDDPAKEDAQK